MSHPKNRASDLTKVQDMISAIRELFSFIKRRKRKDLDKNRMLALAILQEIEIIGEAASQISDAFKEKHSQIPWKAAINTRNRLIHGYGDIDYDIVWDTATNDLKSLLQALEKLL